MIEKSHDQQWRLIIFPLNAQSPMFIYLIIIHKVQFEQRGRNSLKLKRENTSENEKSVKSWECEN